MSVVRTFGVARGVDERSAGLVWRLLLGGELAVLQAQMFDGLSLDPFSLLESECSFDEVSISGGHLFRLSR